MKNDPCQVPKRIQGRIILRMGIYSMDFPEDLLLIPSLLQPMAGNDYEEITIAGL